jgi:MFS family permease
MSSSRASLGQASDGTNVPTQLPGAQDLAKPWPAQPMIGPLRHVQRPSMEARAAERARLAQLLLEAEMKDHPAGMGRTITGQFEDGFGVEHGAAADTAAHGAPPYGTPPYDYSNNISASPPANWGGSPEVHFASEYPAIDSPSLHADMRKHQYEHPDSWSPHGTPRTIARIRASRLRFWSPHSPNFRFFILFLATLVPFGGHVIKYSISSLAHEMLDDKSFGLDHTQLGMFQSALSVPNLFMPILGGLFLDQRGNSRGTILMLCICLIGHTGFVIACMYKSFSWALFARVIFGLGQGSTVVAQGRICATFFTGREIVFAVALTESTHNLANFISFVYVVPVSQWMGGYIWSLWVGVGFCIMSLIAGIIFFAVNPTTEPDDEQIEVARDQENTALLNSENGGYNTFTDDGSHSPGSVASSDSASSRMISGGALAPFRGLSIGFLILCLIHMLYSNTYHLFANISPALIADRFHSSIANAGWLAGLSNGIAIFLCPIAGLWMDWMGFKMWILVFCGCLTTISFLLLLWTAMTPVVPLVLLAIVISFTPTIMKSSVPNLVLPAVFGLAYGGYEISESIGSVIGNSVVGFLRDRTHSWDLDLTIFCGMAITAVLLSLLLICLDHLELIGTGANGKPLGGLNASSFESGKSYDRLKRSKDRWLTREHRKQREAETQQANRRASNA